MKRVWWMNRMGDMVEPRGGDTTSLELLQGKVLSVTAAAAADVAEMGEHRYIVVTDEPTLEELIEQAALSKVLVIEPQTREEVIGHQPRLRPLGQRRVWMECRNRRLD